MTTRILLLGGVTEALAIARRLGPQHIYSLAGIGRVPQDLQCQVRVGGFGGAEGLASYLREAGISLLIDATHAGKRVVVVGDRGHILFSDDQGRSWTQARVPTRQLLTAVFFLDDKRGWAVGHDAQILASSDGGATWTKQFEDLAREAPLLDVRFIDAQHGFAVGAYGALLETTDGGQHWQDVADRLVNPDQMHLNAITQVADAGLFIVGEQGSMFRSSDAGPS